MILRRAAAADLPALLDLRAQAAAWIAAAVGSDQWQDWWPDRATKVAELALAVDAGLTWIAEDDDGPAATITVDPAGAATLWTPAELAAPALYVSWLIDAPRFRGTGLGAELLDWAGTAAAGCGLRLLRADTWTDNTRLHERFWLRRGFRLVRVADAGGRPSAALFERAAQPRPTPRLRACPPTI